ncbi:probable disease resistance protein At5g66900 isoform X1 [Eucalyptus grandis]|uniref:probable disease resistance protein At5g66900 isoform X1 n=1 Tax=Eucalyptus grandis TaxID=71139 RepID=UPI00192EC61C|nr:probable disease resistance protein At5g66900 isoform X1 [Eucalyptus grandis]
MSVDFAGAAVGTAFGELYSLVKEVAKTVAAFHPQLKKIESTLSEMDPIIKKIYYLYEQLDRLKEMDPIKELLDEGKGLVNKCLMIHPVNLYKKYTHSNKLTEYNAAVREKFQIYVPLLAARNDAEMLMKMEEIMGKLSSIYSSQANGGALQTMLEALNNLSVPAAPNFIVGSEVEASLSKLRERLLKEGASVIVLTGPGGCGKTTLLKKLCHDVAIEGKFKDNIMFVPVSKKPNLTDVVQKMYRHNGFKVPEIKSEEDAVHCLQQLLNKIGQNPVLLVLDDVWKESESIVDKFVCDDIKDYKIVVTSRYEFPRFRPVHHLNPLTHDEAVELFLQCATVDDRSMGTPDTKLLSEIVEHCKRLPLVIKVVAKSLRGQHYAFWRKKLNELNDGGSLLDSEVEINTCLRKSLDDMNGDPSIKERFMDLGSFPEDCKIPVTALIDMWVELYRLDPNGLRAFTDLHELVSRNLADLVVTRRDSSDDHESYSSHYYNGHYAQQHDLLRELVIMECDKGEIEKRDRLILELNGNEFPNWWSEQKQQPLSARLVSISTDKTFSTHWPYLELPKAEALVLNFDMQSKTYTLPEFIEKADKLKALIVTNHSFFPAELCNFHVVGANLRRIRFQRVTVPFLSMGNLYLHSLKKISFFMCYISQTSTSNDAKISHAMPNLVELDIDYCDNLVALPDGICEIKPLEKINITNCHNFSTLPAQIGQLTSLEVVRLNSCTSLSLLPDSIRSLQNVKLLDISECQKLSALPYQIGQMVNLDRINMRGCLKLSELPRSIVKLRKLRKVICEKEKAVMWGPLKDTLPSLAISLFEEEPNLAWLE